MFTSTANRIDPQRGLPNRPGQRGSSSDLPAGLALTQIVSGVLENWDDIERQMPWYQPPRTDREPVRQQVVQETALSQKPQAKEEKGKPLSDSPGAVTEGEEGLLGEKTPVSAVKETTAVKVESATAEKTPEKTAEVTAQAALNWRAPEMPKIEGQAVPASFAVPNHSAGASGFGNTWSHAAAARQGDNSIILSE
ncbi:MAG: hypothetical protein KF760_25810 [Candidatus Eremiobacteraeota bacterium]|nr:hypothetical protein [Candidatus Eremiobacteraeota bacterium]MCW5869091.1 hypothetical protein [Candidatus Eremiobacteraeota bacterium]